MGDSVSSAIEIIKGEDNFPNNKEYLSSPIIYGPDGNPLRGSQKVMKDKKILPVSPEEIVEYGERIIRGIDENDLGKVKNWIAVRGQIIGPVATVDKVIDQYLYAMGMEREKYGDYLEAIRKGRTDMPAGVAKEAAKWLEYLLYPDKVLGDFIAQLDAGWADMLSNCYKIKGSMTGRSIDLLIGYLETDKKNAALRQKLKTMLSLAAPNLFDGGILERIKKLSLGNREDVFSFLPAEIKKEVKNIWEKDDGRGLQIIIPKCKQLTKLSPLEFRELLEEVKGIGSEAFYKAMIPSKGPIPHFKRTFGVEVEVRRNQSVVESRFPAEYQGFSNKPEDWKILKELLEDSISGGFDEMGIHCHISREGLEGASQQALSRIIVGWEAILRLFGYSVLLNTYSQESPNIENFFGGEKIGSHQVYINWSDYHPTIEFRFFRNPLYYQEKKVDMEFLAFIVEFGARLIETAITRPEDFSLIKMGIPVVYGKDRIPYSYVAKVADMLYKDDPQGKISFLRFMLFSGMDRKGNLYLPKLVTAQNESGDDSMERMYTQEGLGFLYELHRKQGGWDRDILKTIESLLRDGGGGKYVNQTKFCLLLLFHRSSSQDERTFIKKMLEMAKFSFGDEVFKIKDESLRNSFVKYVLPALLKASADRSEDEILRLAIKWLNDNVASSAVQITERIDSFTSPSLINNGKGGIAFNVLPIRTESVASSALGSFSVSNAFKGDLDAEWSKIQAVFNVGIQPAIQRLSEYTAAASASPLAQDKIDQVRGMLADILRREEEDKKLSLADPALKVLLSALEA